MVVQVLQDFFNQKEDDVLKGRISEMDIQLEDFKGLAEDLKSINVSSQPSWRYCYWHAIVSLVRIIQE